MAEKIRTVILDLGNVLVFHDNARLTRNLAEAAGLEIADVDDWGRRIVDDVNRGRLSGEEIHRGFLELQQQRSEVTATRRLTFARFKALWSSHFTLHDQVLPLVESLIGRVKLALLSNTNALHVEHVRSRLPLLERFDQLLFSNERGMAKPDPAFYLEALRLTRSEPEEALYFDDLSEYVEASKRLGIRGQLFTTAEQFQAVLTQFGLLLPPLTRQRTS